MIKAEWTNADALRTETHACDLISRNAALALVVKAIHGTDSEEIKDYLFGGLRKELWALPSAQPNLQPTCNQLATDCISRAAAIYAIVNTVSYVGLHDNSETARYGATYRQQEIITILKSLPSANKSGHWVMNPSEVAGDGYYICSNCNNDVYDATDFCPNCGSYNGGENHDKG